MGELVTTRLETDNLMRIKKVGSRVKTFLNESSFQDQTQGKGGRDEATAFEKPSGRERPRNRSFQCHVGRPGMECAQAGVGAQRVFDLNRGGRQFVRVDFRVEA